MKKTKLKILRNPTNPVPTEFLSEALSNLLGYEVTQAYTCASIINRTGGYIVKTFSKKDYFLAEEVLTQLTELGITAELQS